MASPRRTPPWLHAALPTLYLLGGLAAAVTLQSRLALASGALLVATALSIALLRQFERRAQRQQQIERHTVFMPAPSRLAATTDFVRDIMPPQLGHADIDRQHRGLARRAATLRVAFFHNDDPADLELLVHDLVDAMAHHVQFEIDAMARLGVQRREDDVDADRLQIANAEYDFHLYCTGAMTLETLIDRVTGPLVTTHLARRHPPLPSMESALQQLRGAKATS